jgi:hypothetical protein
MSYNESSEESLGRFDMELLAAAIEPRKEKMIVDV